MRKEGTKKTVILFFTNRIAETYILGSFNEWKSKLKMEIYDKRNYGITLYLKAGIHQFKFLVDGKWYTSHYYKKTIDNEGNENNYLEVREDENSVRFSVNGKFDQLSLSLSSLDWKMIPFKKVLNDLWMLDLQLEDGIHQYKVSIKEKIVNFIFLRKKKSVFW